MKGLNEGENGDKGLGDYLREAINQGMAIIQGNMVMTIPTLSLIVSCTVIILSTFLLNLSEDQHASCFFAGFKVFNFFFSPGLF